VGNVVLNCVMGTLGNLLYTHFDYSLPSYLEGSLFNLMGSRAPDEHGVLIVVQTVFTVDELQAEGSVFLVFDRESFEAIMAGLARHYSVS
jgi:chemotaxis protein CheC